MEKAKRMFNKEEGFTLKPYRCSRGYLTIGRGHNLDTNGISEKAAELLFEEDLLIATFTLRKAFPKSVIDKLSENRMLGLLNMAFQLGESHFLGFGQMIAAVKKGDWDEAAFNVLYNRRKDSRGEMLISKTLYYQETPARAERVALMIGKELWPEYYDR